MGGVNPQKRFPRLSPWIDIRRAMHFAMGHEIATEKPRSSLD
jgi:hypothetical protein